MTKLFIVEFESINPCIYSHAFGLRCLHSGYRGGICKGNIEIRPDNCPIMEVEIRKFDDEILYAEVET